VIEYRTLGATGLRVSVLGYGAAPLCGVYGDVDEAEGIRTVRGALDLGVNFIDVSPYYGATVAETVLGKALRGVDRSSYVLATKVGRYGEQEFDFSAQRVVRSVDESLARLGCGHIDLIQCHDIEFADLEQVVEETIPAMVRLRETGKVRFVGVTGYPLIPLAYVAGRAPVDTVLSYCRYTLLDRELLRWMPHFESRGIGVINAAPLAMGLLSERGAPPWHPAPARLRDHAAQAAQVCRQRGVDIAQVALRFAVAPPRFATTVVGSASVAEMTRNVRWATEPLDEDLLNEIVALVAPVLNTAWLSGRPENNDLGKIYA
jgi:aryl-alcohol dehydrogenase-like predicted oxidoreductase